MLSEYLFNRDDKSTKNVDFSVLLTHLICYRTNKTHQPLELDSDLPFKYASIIPQTIERNPYIRGGVHVLKKKMENTFTFLASVIFRDLNLKKNTGYNFYILYFLQCESHRIKSEN